MRCAKLVFEADLQMNTDLGQAKIEFADGVFMKTQILAAVLVLLTQSVVVCADSIFDRSTLTAQQAQEFAAGKDAEADRLTDIVSLRKFKLNGTNNLKPYNP